MKRNFSVVAKIRRKRNPTATRKVSKILTRTFGHFCDNCSKHSLSLHAHHIIAFSRGGRDNPLNMKYLCERCHSLQPNHHHMRK